MQIISGIIHSLLVTVVACSPTPTTHEKPSRARARDASSTYTDAVDPNHPHYSFESQCTYSDVADAAWQYNVVIANAKAFTKDECGSGFLDNIHGHGCTVTGWGCNYATDASGMDYMEANFAVDFWCDSGNIGSAIWNAFGHLDGIACVEYNPTPEVDLPPVDLPPEKA